MKTILLIIAIIVTIGICILFTLDMLHAADAEKDWKAAVQESKEFVGE